MELEVRAIQESDILMVSRFLITGFGTAADAEFAAPDVLRWKCFDPQGQADYPRGFVAMENGRIVAYVGQCPTQFVGASLAKPVSAGHGIDWLAAKENIGAGLEVGPKGNERVDVGFSIGGTAIAIKIKKRIKAWKFGVPVPTYCRVLRPAYYLRSPRPDALWKCLAKIVRESGRWLLHPRQKPNVSIVLKQVESFGAEVTQIVDACQMPEIHTLRTPELLNHFLRYPRQNITGWHIMQENQIRGFTLLSLVRNGNIRTGKIADCFLDSLDVDLWHAALHALTNQLREQSADMVVCYGTTSWMVEALTQNGFYQQRLSPFAIRDPKKLLPENASYYLTHLEADHAYL